jgi:hypothetical protein
MKLRFNPTTGRFAERLPADVDVHDGKCWFTYRWDEGAGLTVELLADEDVADWPEATLTPKPTDPEFAYALACGSCPTHPMTTDVDERERLATAHEDLDCAADTSRYAVKVRHPNLDPEVSAVDAIAPGSEVTFWGSTTGEVAHLVDAVVIEADPGHVTSDGETVAGYDVSVQGRTLFVPDTALAAFKPSA